MKFSVFPVLIVLVLSYSSHVYAQQEIEISRPDLSLKGSTLLISYDIHNSVPSDVFTIGIEARDGEGKLLYPKAIIGDVGENVKGGSNKEIEWELAEDGIDLKTVLNIVVVGSMIQAEKVLASDSPSVSRWGALGRSAVFPGWGLTAADPGKPYWITGIVFYSSLGGSVALNQSAHKNYQNYLDSGNPDERSMYYDKSVNQEIYSNICLYSAVGIWTVDMIWTIFGTRGLSKRGSEGKGMSLRTSFDELSSTPLLSINYTF